MSIADQLAELVNQKKQLARNITEKGVQASEDETLNTLVPKVLEIEGGGGGAVIEDVIFHDSYDNTVVAAYSKDEFANLTAMPQNPTHTGLISQGWNWTLSDAQRYVAKYGALDIGQMYITNDENTRVYIHLQDGRKSPCVGLFVDGTATIDWGDGSSATTLTGSVADWDSLSYDEELFTEPHEYESAGDYVITITVSGKVEINTHFYNLDNETVGCSLLSYANNYESSHQNIIYINSITAVEIGDNVWISSGSFSLCQSLSRITIPRECKQHGCMSFILSPHSITIPDTWESMYQGFGFSKNIENVSIPNSITDMEGAFEYTSGMTRLTVPDSVITIGSVPDSLQTVVIPESVSNASSNLLSENTLLKNAVLMAEPTDDGMFQNCTNLSNVVLGESITKIVNSMFSGCVNLTEITLPSGVTEIGEYAFSGCTSLQSINIPSSVTKIGEYAFANCTGLKSVTLHSGIVEIGNHAFQNCASLQSIAIPSSVTKIGSSAFESCVSLKNITLPNSVSEIGSGAFASCTSLQDITLPSSLTKLSRSVLNNCESMSKITIPANVTEIQSRTFQGSCGITEIYCTSSQPPTIYLGFDSYIWPTDAADGEETPYIIYVPNGSAAAYIEAGYPEEHIQEMN